MRGSVSLLQGQWRSGLWPTLSQTLPFLGLPGLCPGPRSLGSRLQTHGLTIVSVPRLMSECHVSPQWGGFFS